MNRPGNRREHHRYSPPYHLMSMILYGRVIHLLPFLCRPYPRRTIDQENERRREGKATTRLCIRVLRRLQSVPNTREVRGKKKTSIVFRNINRRPPRLPAWGWLCLAEGICCVKER